MMEPKLDRRCGTPESKLREALLRNPPVGLPSTAKARPGMARPCPSRERTLAKPSPQRGQEGSLAVEVQFGQHGSR